MKKALGLVGIMVAIATVSGCAQSVTIGIGNRFASNCNKQGGKMSTEKGAVADRNTCVLSDGSSFEEWVQHPQLPAGK